MNSIMFIRTILLAMMTFYTISVFANTVTVQGQNNAAIDRVAIQSAINNANSGDMIKLMGTFQLDGQHILIKKSNLTIMGVGSSGNWSTVIKGITSSGVPVGDNGSTHFNRGFSIGPTSGKISNVSIKNIKFTGLNRAILVSPSIQTTSSNCSDITITNGTASNININNNWFDNDVGAVDARGSSSNVSINNNLLTNNQSRGILVVGTITTCAPFPPGFVLIGLPSFIDISGNTINNDSSVYPIEVLAADHVNISDNSVINSNNSVPIVVQGITNSIVSNNILQGGSDTFAGIFAETIIAADPSWPIQVEPIKNSIILNNQIQNVSAGVGIVVDNNVSDLAVINNKFSNSGVSDILMCGSTATGVNANFCDFFFPEFGATPPSSKNLVIAPSCTTVYNLGVNNVLAGFISLSTNPNVAPTGQCKWIANK